MRTKSRKEGKTTFAQLLISGIGNSKIDISILILIIKKYRLKEWI
jgi:hypothetical protein